MRVHQPGGHLMRERDVRVDDWSWGKTRRRLGLLWRLMTPYRRRAAFSVISLLLATVTALAPPYLAKLALDDAIGEDVGASIYLIVAIFLAAGIANCVMYYVETYMTGWVGERVLADLRTTLFDHLQRLSLGFYERNRAGVIISRLTNDVEAIDQLVTDGVTVLFQSTLTLIGTAVILFVLDWRLALATLLRHPADGLRDRDLPHALGARLRLGARAPRPRHGDARRGHRRHAHRAGVHARGRAPIANFRNVATAATASRTCRRS